MGVVKGGTPYDPANLRKEETISARFRNAVHRAEHCKLKSGRID